MSIRLVIIGYSLSLVAAIVGCIVIARSRNQVPGLNWLIAAISTALVGLVLLYSRSSIPDFFSIVVANEAMLATLVLLHQAIATILESSQRYLRLSLGVAAALFAAFLYYTYASNDFGARVLLRTAAVAVQILISVVVLFRHKDPAASLSAPGGGLGAGRVWRNTDRAVAGYADLAPFARSDAPRCGAGILFLRQLHHGA
jgi:hypothetical protein